MPWRGIQTLLLDGHKNVEQKAQKKELEESLVYTRPEVESHVVIIGLNNDKEINMKCGLSNISSSLKLYNGIGSGNIDVPLVDFLNFLT